MLIKELWIRREADGEITWDECVVISLYKASMGSSNGKESLTTEQMMALCYYPITGEIIEYPLNECIIKTLEDEKNKSVKTFSCPEEGGTGRKENRSHNSAGNNKA